MMVPPEIWLVITATAATISALVAVVLVQFGLRRAVLGCAIVGFIVGSLSAGCLTASLSGGEDGSDSPVRLILWSWFALLRPNSLSVSFGLEASALKSGFIAFAGLIALAAILAGALRNEKQLSTDAVLTSICLYAASILFVFAPNLSQAVLGWAAVSGLTAALIRQTFPDIRFNSRPAAQSNRISQAITSSVEILDRLIIAPIHQAITHQFPGWLAEQVEIIEASSLSFQLLTMVMFGSVVLLTWLLINV